LIRWVLSPPTRLAERAYLVAAIETDRARLRLLRVRVVLRWYRLVEAVDGWRDRREGEPIEADDPRRESESASNGSGVGS